LVAHLGFKTVGELERDLPQEEFEKWVILRDREPWGVYRLDFLFGLLRHTLIGQWSTKENPPPPLKDLIPRWDIDPPKTREQLEAEADEEWARSSANFIDLVS